MEVVRIVMLGMTGVLLGLFLKGTKPEYSIYISLAAGILIFFYMTEKLSYLFSSVLSHSWIPTVGQSQQYQFLNIAS